MTDTLASRKASPGQTLLLTGATGFVGRAAHDALVEAGWQVRCGTRDVARAAAQWPTRSWAAFDAGSTDSVVRALEGCDAVVYLVHGMAAHHADFRRAEIAQASRMAEAAARAGVRRLVYLGGVASPEDPSEHLRSREEVGEVLRAGSVSTLELRASMIVGHGSLSWTIVRDLAARLPVMVLPRWLKSRTQPVSIDDIVVALVRAASLDHEGSAWFDVPGPDTLSGRQILEQTADVLQVHQPLMIEVPLLSPRLSSHWVRLVTRAEWSVAREIVVGLKHDLLAKDDRFWHLAGHTALLSFQDSARRALAAEAERGGPRGLWGQFESMRRGRVPQSATHA
jgi:uncharacterized protein YbjT (DUF2867 family)